MRYGQSLCAYMKGWHIWSVEWSCLEKEKKLLNSAWGDFGKGEKHQDWKIKHHLLIHLEKQQKSYSHFKIFNALYTTGTRRNSDGCRDKDGGRLQRGYRRLKQAQKHRHAYLLQQATQAAAQSLIKSGRLGCLVYICLHVSFPFFICPRKASSQGRNLITILSHLRVCLKAAPERMTGLLSFPAVSTGNGFLLILSPATL